MTELPGYDAWKLRSPDVDAYPCTCTHEYGDHVDSDVTYGDDDYGYDSYSSMVCTVCKCTEYREYTREDYEDDMRERRAEYRRGL